MEEDFSSSSLDEEDIIVRRVTERLSDPDYLRGKGQEQGRFDAETAFRKLRRRNSRRVMIRVGSVAAVLVLIVGIVVLYKGDFSQEKNVLKLTQGVIPALLPGTNKAILHLADGRELVLNDALRAKIETKEGVVEVDSMGVVYGIKVDSVATEKVQEYHVMTIPRGGEFHLTLADGTQVWLNSETELRFPVHFAGGERKVYLKGEAYFDVTEDAARPFVVETSMGDIKVLGTSFNVMTYRGRTITTLVEGKVCLTYKDESVLMVPDRQAEVIAETGKILMREVDARNFTLWKDGVFYFENAALETIAERLSQWYDVNIVFNDEALKQLRYSVEMKRYNNIQDLLTKIEKTQKVKFLIQGKSIYIHKWLETYDLLE